MFADKYMLTSCRLISFLLRIFCIICFDTCFLESLLILGSRNILLFWSWYESSSFDSFLITVDLLTLSSNFWEDTIDFIWRFWAHRPMSRQFSYSCWLYLYAVLWKDLYLYFLTACYEKYLNYFLMLYFELKPTGLCFIMLIILISCLAFVLS